MTNNNLTNESIFEKLNVSGEALDFCEVFRKINENSIPLSAEEFRFIITNTK